MISILLSTFNSENYLREQIDSILSQSYRRWQLIIRDDGSSDSTIPIIESYVEQHSNIIHYKDRIKNLGAKDSFIILLENISSEYYMFCDHDDIWLPDKIELTFDLLRKNEKDHPNKPVLIFTDLCVVDSELNQISQSMWNSQRSNPGNAKDIYRLSISNPVTGCTIMINKRAKEVSLPVCKEAIMHDIWIAMNVSNYGVVDFLRKSTILYRQHGENVIGAQNVNYKYYIKRFLNIRLTILDNIKMIIMLAALSFRINFFKWTTLKIYSLLKKGK